ncbi:hypothetical protein R5W24_003364 [Gemmata sp. JC717]|uniref:hypothetical protein n=1 Tax=Gemmata algarum TaxID=2975278 RepID=UPI0021BBB1C6|nr:hypothetical protein [Gemmata algarum]MDY3554245.1 hypothetical protein [Gemmata algarum]
MEEYQIGQRVEDKSIRNRGKGTIVEATTEPGTMAGSNIHYVVKWDGGGQEGMVPQSELRPIG